MFFPLFLFTGLLSNDEEGGGLVHSGDSGDWETGCSPSLSLESLPVPNRSEFWSNCACIVCGQIITSFFLYRSLLGV